MGDPSPSEEMNVQPNDSRVSLDPPRGPSLPFPNSLKGHTFNIYLSTLLRTFAVISSLVAIICLCIAVENYYINKIIILPLIVLFISLVGHLAGLLWNTVPAMLYVEFKGKDWTGPGSGSALGLAEAGREGDFIAEVARRASRWGVRTWDSSIGALLGVNNLLAIITAMSGESSGESVAGIVFGGITAAIHITLTNPRLKTFRLAVICVAFPFSLSENGVSSMQQQQEMYHDTETTDLEQGTLPR